MTQQQVMPFGARARGALWGAQRSVMTLGNQLHVTQIALAFLVEMAILI
jgi:hypothetical protein